LFNEADEFIGERPKFGFYPLRLRWARRWFGCEWRYQPEE